jgi:ferredoxin/flavodoxin
MAESDLILYFSGTGNSRMVARAAAGRLAGARLLPLLDPSAAEAVRAASRVGVVFPVHFMQAPAVVLAALGSLKLDGKDCFAVASSGGTAGDALGQVADRLRSRGGRLIAAAHVPLADNSAVLRTPAPELARNLAAAGPLLDALAADLAASPGLRAGRRPLYWKLSGGALRLGMRLACAYGRKSAERALCTGCGLCARACPTGNIRVDGGRVAFGRNCADCFGCLHACPVSAIRFGRIRVTPDSRYRPLAPDALHGQS